MSKRGGPDPIGAINSKYKEWKYGHGNARKAHEELTKKLDRAIGLKELPYNAIELTTHRTYGGYSKLGSSPIFRESVPPSISISYKTPDQWGRIVEYLKLPDNAADFKSVGSGEFNYQYRGIPVHILRDSSCIIPIPRIRHHFPGSEKLEKKENENRLENQRREATFQSFLSEMKSSGIETPLAHAPECWFHKLKPNWMIAVACRDEAEKAKVESLLAKVKHPEPNQHPYTYKGYPVAIYMIGSKHP